MINFQTKPDPIHVSFAFDKNYIIPFFVAATSICLNNKSNRVKFHVIATGINREAYNEIGLYINYIGGEIFFYRINEEYIKQFFIPDDSYFTSSIYFRLFLPLLVPSEVDKLIYLDTDAIVINNLLSLNSINLGEIAVGAVKDSQMVVRKDIGINDRDNYFNSGVLLIDVGQWKIQDITGKSIEFINKTVKELKFPDQDALNVVLMNNWLRLDQRFNVMKIDVPNLQKDQRDEFLKDKVIIHYNDITKPWTKGMDHPLKYLFDEYYKLFVESAIGEVFIKSNIENQFTHLIMVDLKEENNDFETIILLGFSLHLCWINAIKRIYPEKDAIAFLAEYFRADEQEVHLIATYFHPEFEINKELLIKVYHEIVPTSTVTEYEATGWIKTWKEICDNEVNALKFSDDENLHLNIDRLSKLPVWINKQMRIPKIQGLLLRYFVKRCFYLTESI